MISLLAAGWLIDDIKADESSAAPRAGDDWWSFQPLSRPPIPPVQGSFRVHNPVDVFVGNRRSAAGLKESDPASRASLFRRLYFDLHGLPPSPVDVDHFVEDQTPHAYERWVDRVLAAPQYGERWARHWLDVARFGESQGFERDHLRLHSWRYRDWVVEALNQNLPYDEFAQMQLAGDVMFPDRPQGLVATGFLVAGAYDIVGQTQQSGAMRAVVRQDEMEDYVSTVGQAFLGLTVHCARCHDHKFDPILQREYYQLSAALTGVKPGDRKVFPLTDLNRYDARIEHLERRLAANAQPAIDKVLATRRRLEPLQSSIEPVAEFNSQNLKLGSKARWDGDAALFEKSIQIQLQPGLDGSDWQRLLAFTDHLGNPKEVIWLGNEGRVGLSYEGGQRSLLGRVDTSSGDLAFTLVFQEGGKVWLFQDGQPIGVPMSWRSPVKYPSDQYAVQISEAVSGQVKGDKWERRFGVRIFDAALSAVEVATESGVVSEYVSEDEIRMALDPEDKLTREALAFERDQLIAQRKRLMAAEAYAIKPRSVEPVYLLNRGNPATPGETVYPGGVEALKGVSANFNLRSDASDADRRTALARWISAPTNPLFARVIVNRLWLHHFGAGLVETPSDFGFSGGRPSHPELLDWLASELIDRDWDLKAIHRLIVTSATYRQSSRIRPSAHSVDADNRLLWRMSPRRLEAEGLRDAILEVSGLLNDEMGGPGFQDFTTYVHNSQFYSMLDPVGETFHRRSLYRTWVRSGRSPFLDVFDCPDPSATAPKRAVTTTPLQSLTLMNHSFVLRMSEALAERMKNLQVDDLSEEVRQVYRWSFGREPSPEGLADAVSLIEMHGRASFARAIFNSSEFLYVD